MKIVIAVASFASSISGIQRHGLNVARCLLSQPEISALHLVVAPWQRKFVEEASLAADARLSVHIAEIARGTLSRNLWYYRRLPKLAAQVHADVVHLSYPMPVDASAFRCPTVVTLHDLYPYEIPMNFGFPKCLLNRIALRQCLRNVNTIACVSDATHAQLTHYAPAAVWRKAVRIYNCVEPQPFLAAESPIPNWRGEPFLLGVAQHRRNKNLPLLLRTFDRLLRSGEIDPRTSLVIIGMSGPETAKIRRLAGSLGLERSIHFLEGLPEPELQWCYGRCEALVAPSSTEGFGLPVAEGMLAGCRIICSDIPAHREIGSGYCRFVALENNADSNAARFAAAIAGTLRGPRKKPTTLPKFSAPVIAKQYLRLYEELFESEQPAHDLRLTRPLSIGASERQSL